MTTLKIIRKCIKKVYQPNETYFDNVIKYTYEWAQYSGDIVSSIIKNELLLDKPSLITRFGATEMLCLLNFLHNRTSKNIFRYIKSEIDYIGWRQSTGELMWKNSGFFPPTNENLLKFSEMIIDILPEIDILGTWLKQEQYFFNKIKQAKRVPLYDLEPWYYDDPWTKLLKGKNVLVIHPFETSILKQYKNRKFLFNNDNILPDFNLLTIKAVQSVARNTDNFKSWFEAFEYMKSKIDKMNFDIAILGCGAYGMPLAAYIKKLGKKAIHLGGATQLLFGIKGRRWENCETCGNSDFYMKLYNPHWIRPLEVDVPQNFSEADNGSYW